MKNILWALAILIPSITLGQIGEKNFIDQNYIEVTGKSEMEITPNMIYLKVILNEKDTKNKVSVSELENQMVDKLKEIGIDIDKNLFIKDMSSNFKFYLLAKKEIFLSKEYQILVNDGKTASRVFVELEKIGISNVSIEKLDHSKMEEFRKETKINAIKSAKQKAEFLANAVDQNIGKALYIQELDNYNGFAKASNSIMIRGASSIYGSKAELDVDFEKIKIEYSILCRFELK
ncbi:MAG: SIMPL domain-containing protein [Bacteroidales bacterium]